MIDRTIWEIGLRKQERMLRNQDAVVEISGDRVIVD
jgi:hypothetical protein